MWSHSLNFLLQGLLTSFLLLPHTPIHDDRDLTRTHQLPQIGENAMATVSTATVKKNTPTSITDVTGSKRGPKKGVARGRLTKPMLHSSTERLGAVANKAREIAGRNGGYCNADMIFRELESHPVFKELVYGPEGVEPAVAYSLLSPTKVKDWYNEYLEAVTTILDASGNRVPRLHALTGEPINPHVAYEEGGPKKGALPILANMRGQKFINVEDEL